MAGRFQLALILAGLSASVCLGQNDPQDKQAPDAEKEDKRILFVIPNYRTSPSLHPYVPLTTRQKFKLGSMDSFDRGTVVLAALFAGDAMLQNSDPTFGQGMKGYGHYLGTSYSDLLIGNFMTESLYPTLLHHDPRYFRRGKGTGWSRLGYAAGQIFWTHTDKGGTAFNLSEIGGNATAVAISTSYYPGNRNTGDAVSKFGTQIGVDIAANILKEFWPDLNRKFGRHKK